MHDRARQLLAQLVNSPASLSRNRHFSLYEEPRVAVLRRRASYLRDLRDALLVEEAYIERSRRKDQKLMLCMKYASGSTRRTWLTSAEASILKEAVLPEASASLRADIERW